MLIDVAVVPSPKGLVEALDDYVKRAKIQPGTGVEEGPPPFPSQPWDLTAMPVDPGTKAVTDAITAEVYSEHPLDGYGYNPDAPIQIEVLPGTFPIDARPLHADLQVGRNFPTWMGDRIKKFKLVENVDYIACPGKGEQKMRSGEQTGRGGDRSSIEYRLTILTARKLAADVQSKRGVQVI